MSLSVIAAVSAAVVGGTGAFFSDTETSTGNTFTAGAIDLKVDSQQHYNGNVCVLNESEAEDAPEYVWSGTSEYPVVGTECNGTWAETDLGITHKFFDFDDVKPGDEGENTISLHVINNDAWVCATVSNLVDADNSLTEPETPVDADGMVSGELKEAMIVTIWSDNGQSGGVAGDNVQNGTEPTLFSGQAQNGTWPLYTPATTVTPLAGDTTGYLGVAWSLPIGTGNEAQTDSLSADISFNVAQARNNPNFTCTPQLVN